MFSGAFGEVAFMDGNIGVVIYGGGDLSGSTTEAKAAYNWIPVDLFVYLPVSEE